MLLFILLITATLSLVCKNERGEEKTVADAYINDNYCDCMKDGEDETTTSACAHTKETFRCAKDLDKKDIPLSFLNGTL